MATATSCGRYGGHSTMPQWRPPTRGVLYASSLRPRSSPKGSCSVVCNIVLSSSTRPTRLGGRLSAVFSVCSWAGSRTGTRTATRASKSGISRGTAATQTKGSTSRSSTRRRRGCVLSSREALHSHTAKLALRWRRHDAARFRAGKSIVFISSSMLFQPLPARVFSMQVNEGW